MESQRQSRRAEEGAWEMKEEVRLWLCGWWSSNGDERRRVWAVSALQCVLVL